MIPGQTALEINRVGRADRAVGGKLDGRALHEGACRHDDLVVIAGHGPGDRLDVGIHRSGGLNALAEGPHSGLGAELDGLNDVVALLRAAGNDPEAQPLIEAGGKDRALERTGDHGRGQEQTLIEARQDAEIRADLLPQTRGREPVGAALHAGLRADDVAADRGQSAAGVLDQTADAEIRADLGGLKLLHELAVAVVHHHQHVGLDALAEGDQLADLRHGEGRPRRVALRALDRDELGLFVDRGADGGVVEAAVGQQIHLTVAYAVFRQRAGGGPDADDLLQGVVGQTDGGEQLVPGQEVGRKGHRQRVGPAGDLRADQGGLGPEDGGVYLLQPVAAHVVVAVARRGGKAGRVHAGVLHGADDLALIELRHPVNGVKPIPQRVQDRFAVFVYGARNPVGFIGLQKIHGVIPFGYGIRAPLQGRRSLTAILPVPAARGRCGSSRRDF